MTTHPDLLVGIEGSDDAGVFRLREDLALVQTVDFFTPIVDEAGDWGRIAAANALSDIYAMGGTPLTALQLVGWPRDELPFDLLGEAIRGAAEVLEAAGVTLVGGHSVDDPEPKLGFAVTGIAHPGSILTNRGSAAGDALILTKPIGTGIVSTGIKRGVAEPGERDAAVASMIALNDIAGTVAAETSASAATDVTGFGLLGHLREMLGDGVGAVVHANSIPLLPGARRVAEAGAVPGGTRRNLRHAESFTDFGESDEIDRLLLADAQTSGGLLIAADEETAYTILPALTRRGVFPAIIGGIVDDHPGEVRVQ